jgi:hypothetical protein
MCAGDGDAMIAVLLRVVVDAGNVSLPAEISDASVRKT